MPQQKNAKGGMPQYDDLQRLRNRSSSEKIYKRSDELKDGDMPQCKIVTNIRYIISPYKTLQDMVNDDAMNKCLNKTIHHRNYADKAKLK